MKNKFKIIYISYETREVGDRLKEVIKQNKSEIEAHSFYFKDGMVVFHGSVKDNSIAAFSNVVSIERI